MRVRFWGVRGSIATPGPETTEFGGNTTCVEVVCGDERIIFDAGTGIRGLGQELMSSLPLRAHLFFTHTHWDHIQGLPFFQPAYVPGGRLDVYGLDRATAGIRQLLEGQMSEPYFPIQMGAFGAELHFHDIDGHTPVQIGEVTVTPAILYHPDGVAAYRVDYRGASMVLATDTEHVWSVDPRLNCLAEGADVLIHDAQFFHEEYTGETGLSRVGWGHSTVDSAVEQAVASRVGELILFHHDPDRNDQGMRDLEEYAQTLLPSVRAAREGMTLLVPSDVGSLS